MRAAWAWAGLLLAGCGSTTYDVLDRPTRPFNAYGALRTLQVEDRSATKWNKDEPPYTEELGKVLQGRLADEEFWRGSGLPLKIVCRILEYESEYSDPKLWGGGGGMIWGRIVLEVEFRGEDDRNAGRVRATGFSKARGWGIASMAAAERRALQALVNFISDNYEEVEKP